MLDNEPTATTDSSTTTDKPAPRSRRRAAARPAGPPAVVSESATKATADDKPKKAAGKKSTAKKTAKRAAATAETDQVAAETVTKATKKSTAKKAAKKSATKKASKKSAEKPVDEPAASESAKKSRATGAPTVLFQPPAADAAPSSSRRRTQKNTESADKSETPDGDAGGSGADDDSEESGTRRRRRRGGRGRRGRSKADGGSDAEETEEHSAEDGSGSDTEAGDGDSEGEDGTPASRRRRRRRRKGTSSDAAELAGDDPARTVVHVREPRKSDKRSDEISGVRGSTRLEAKKQRRREGREQGRRRPPVLTESEFLARREAVDRVMVIRQQSERTQIGVLEDNVLVEHYVAQKSASTMVGTVYLGKVQNVLPSMEAAFVDVGRGRNAVLYAGEVNWDAAGLDGQPRRIEHAMKSGDSILVQVTKDPIGHKGARLTAQVSLPGRYLVYVPDGSMTGISRKLPDTERTRLKNILKRIVPDDAGVIVRTAAEGASEDELQRDVDRLSAQWESISEKAKTASAPELLYEEPDLTIRVVRDVFNEDFNTLIVSGAEAWDTVDQYVNHVAPDLAPRLSRWTEDEDVFAAHRIDEQLTKALDRKVWLPSGGYLIIDPTEAMTVVDVNTGKFTGSGGNLEETVTKNNIEAAEEIVRQLRLRDVGGIIVVDFIDMVLESNRELVLRRLVECLGRDRTKHQVAEVTSLGLVQMTRKRVGQGLLDTFSTVCETCNGRGRNVQLDPVEVKAEGRRTEERGSRRRRGAAASATPVKDPELDAKEAAAKAALIKVAAASGAAKLAESAADGQPDGYADDHVHAEPELAADGGAEPVEDAAAANSSVESDDSAPDAGSAESPHEASPTLV
ncbi:MAG TPA: Rne/Rng family ribonuclease [Actinomycetes bacterium]|nr:Rne/Rng family ribonuclease [Actinomycetes bacterium]